KTPSTCSFGRAESSQSRQTEAGHPAPSQKLRGGHEHRPTPDPPITRIEPSLRPEQRARDGTFWRRSNVISSRRRDQIPDPDAEGTPGIASPPSPPCSTQKGPPARSVA